MAGSPRVLLHFAKAKGSPKPYQRPELTDHQSVALIGFSVTSLLLIVLVALWLA